MVDPPNYQGGSAAAKNVLAMLGMGEGKRGQMMKIQKVFEPYLAWGQRSGYAQLKGQSKNGESWSPSHPNLP